VGASLSFTNAIKAVTGMIGDATDYAALKTTFVARGLQVGWCKLTPG